MADKARIISMGSFVPERRLTNADLEKMVETSDEWIVTRTGIRERRIASCGECNSDFGVAAARKTLETAGKSASEVDLILVATCTPDHHFPSTAALIQKELGAEGAAIFDFQAACTGYIYGLSLVKALVESGLYRNVLLIASEKLSSFVDYEDRSTCILFGDGASAALISNEGPGLEIEHVSIGGDGAQASLLLIEAGGSRLPASAETVEKGQHTITMAGRELFKQAVRRMEQAAASCLEVLQLSQEDIRWFVPHQANARIIESVAKRLAFPEERIYLTVHKYGNTSASSVPLALDELCQEEKFVTGDRLLTAAFGAGLTWGAAVLRQL